MENYKEKNKKQLMDYFESNCREDAADMAGMTLEHFIVRGNSGKTVGIYGEQNIEWILKNFTPRCRNIYAYKRRVIGVERKDYSLFLGPGGQLVLSVAQKPDLKKTENVYKRFYRKLKEVLEETGDICVNFGYHPVSTMGEIPMIDSPYNEQMKNYFDKVGTSGEIMMKGTASTQITIGYKDEAEFRTKMRAAFILAPVFSFMTDNSPYFEGEPYPRRLLRQYIWQRVDSERTTIPPFIFEKEFGFEDYADYVLGIPQMFFKDRSKGYYTNLGARELYSDRPIPPDAMERTLKLVMTDVRLRDGIELRMGDSMPVKAALSYMAFIKGLFADTGRLFSFTSELGVSSANQIDEAKTLLRKEGENAVIYGKPVNKIIKDLFVVAAAGLSDMDKPYLSQKSLERRRVLNDWK